MAVPDPEGMQKRLNKMDDVKVIKGLRRVSFDGYNALCRSYGVGPDRARCSS